MLSGVTDTKVLGYLGRALSLELSAVQMYSTQSRLVANWGLDKVAGRLRDEAREETEHAERIIAQMLFLGVAPGASQLRAVKLGPDLPSLLRINQAFEMELVELYRNAVNYCRLNSLQQEKVFFASLLAEEEQHAVGLKSWLNEIEAE